MSFGKEINSEYDLLDRLRKGDHDAFTQLYEKYSVLLIPTILRLLKSPELPEELLQKLFIKIWDSREQIDPTKSFKAYVYRIAQNMVYYSFREDSRQKRLLDFVINQKSESYSHIEEDLINKEMEDLVKAAIEKLPPKRKEVYLLFRYEEKSYKEISDLLHISTSTINDHLQKANKFLREEYSFLPTKRKRDILSKDNMSH